MTYLTPAVERRAEDLLIHHLDHHMGNALFLGAALPRVILHLVNKGLFVTVVDSDSKRLASLSELLRQHRADRNVSLDQRPYEDIEFLSSSYNAIFAWNGIPDGMSPALFFKKARRELKAGNTLYLRIRQELRHHLALAPQQMETWLSKAPGNAAWVPWLSHQLARVRQTLRPACVDIPALNLIADPFLQPGQPLPISVIAERLDGLPKPVPALLPLVESPLPGLASLETALLSLPLLATTASSVFLTYSKTREFGKVFRI